MLLTRLTGCSVEKDMTSCNGICAMVSKHMFYLLFFLFTFFENHFFSTQIDKVFEHLQALAKKFDVTVIIATHDYSLASKADSIYHIENGSLV